MTIIDYSAKIETITVLELASNTMEIASKSSLLSIFRTLNATSDPNVTISYGILSACDADDSTVSTFGKAIRDGSFDTELKKNYNGRVKVQKGIYVYIVRNPIQVRSSSNSKKGIYISVYSCFMKMMFKCHNHRTAIVFYFSHYNSISNLVVPSSRT